VREFWPDDPAARAEREASIAEARATGLARQFGVPYRTRSGRVIRVDSTRTTVLHGGRRYDVSVFRDAGERESAEAARREVADLRAINLVATAAAHEINNPLAVVVGSLELLVRRLPAGAAEGRLVGQAVEAGQRIRDIVVRMNRITRVETDATGAGLPEMLDIRKSSENRR
jgi:signal transduction histidine kinase